ncbi:hypothetical protein E6P09_19030 (plasmid) [Haloferax mediterranei ATCC 33500]|uniref:DUF8160 domain-containing protein n=1 Tax=Haloferax mediterranei (strain ATCC 33500 / DSM 1411 / JCM 8866 / NBRC 14739 / NCIMB 2177 / R-4) TaxID=523841 RepID=I3R924_HALMT|nr:hypothetical protein [Haloferax mediterranei]AFK20734.1 hypothetical protein HFX_4039 [Haloferax mediterranei ATCC 33500]AHZ24014.1 hypothetical protein BM92_19615 [Haloferax mediterranei ATCC 33500]ELZ97596.1 hypothetical protein C439_16808 [Haloferax mediterranei ATCC 33500]MDX5989688.1 hypothetical protein [Haloferax mediterranei ATCC 33500]QCQ77410.1 hypothetical protein E6P09_19030 [Haloferax mediterranei ATCC 33500]
MSDDEIDSRLNRRFGGEADDQKDTNDKNAENSESAMNAEKQVRVKNPWDAESVKSEWNGVTVYLPDPMKKRLDKQYQRLNYECDFQILKDRHVKPLVIEYGLDAVAEMAPDDVQDALDELEREYSSEEHTVNK